MILNNLRLCMRRTKLEGFCVDYGKCNAGPWIPEIANKIEYIFGAEMDSAKGAVDFLCTSTGALRFTTNIAVKLPT